MPQKLFKTKVVYDQLMGISKELREHSVLRKMVTTDFEIFVSLNPKAAEHFSLYVDKQMRTIQDLCAKTMVQDLSKMLDQAFVFFRFIRDKDVLEFSCRQHLAKRLLFKITTVNNIDCEKGLIYRIKVNKPPSPFCITKTLIFSCFDRRNAETSIRPKWTT